MMHKHILLGLILILLCTNTAFSQGNYLKKGNNGVGLGFGYSSNSNVSGITANIGYSSSGIFDVGLSYGRYIIDSLGLSAISIVPSLTFHAIKQEPAKFPLSISLDLAYERDKYSGHSLGIHNYEMYGDYFIFGFNIFGNINSTSPTTFQPYGSVSYITGTTKIKYSYGNTISEDNNVTSFGFGFSIYFESSPNTILEISQGISITEDNTTFAISLGLILPSK